MKTKRSKFALILSIFTVLIFPCSIFASDGFSLRFETSVLQTLSRTDEIPGFQSEEFKHLKSGIAQYWQRLVKEGELQVRDLDKAIRPYFVALQATVEHELALALSTGQIRKLNGIILTPMPATPLCTEGEISPELVNPDIAQDPYRKLTIQSRAQIIRSYLHLGGVLQVTYPKKGINKRTEHQRNIYERELSRYPGNLIDLPLNCESIPEELIGAFYLFEDAQGDLYSFAIKIPQAKNPFSPDEQGEFCLWFGPVNHPGIQQRINESMLFIGAALSS